jgi:hypothetical protein
MKRSFKTTTLIAAIGMIVYTAYVLTRYVLGEYFGIHYVFNLATEIRIRLIYDILPLSMVVACCGLLKYRPAENASKSFRVFTICLLVALVGTLLFSPLYTIQIAGSAYIFPSIYWRAIMLISGIVWLFMLRKQASEEASPRSYRVTLILAILLLTLPIILEAFSGISCMLNSHVLNFDSDTIKAWIRWIVPTLVMVHFVFPQIKTINTTRNSHCTPDSFDESTFNRNRATTLILIGVAITALLVICLRKPMLRGSYLFHYYVLHDLEWSYTRALTLYDEVIPCISAFILCISGILSWIMLSIMAFRQLPNPRGYKIYNTVCQIITWGSFGVTFLAPNGIDEIFITIFLVSFCAFFITTTIRVISYSLPKQLEQ